MGHKMAESKAIDKGELQSLESANATALQTVLSWIVWGQKLHTAPAVMLSGYWKPQLKQEWARDWPLKQNVKNKKNAVLGTTIYYRLEKWKIQEFILKHFS